MKVLAIGDVHAKTWMLYEIAELVDLYDKVVFCGDYADNFNAPPTHTLATWRLVRQLMQAHPDKVHALIGNHDYSYIHPEIAGRSSGWNPVIFTLINTPEKKELKKWLLNLPISVEIEGVTYSHAGITNEWDGQQTVNSMWGQVSPIWARPREYGGNVTYKEGLQVFGHSPSKKIWNPTPNTWCIDTFSQDQNNNFIGDKSLLEVVDGKDFNIIPKEILNEDNSNTSGVEDKIS